MSPKRTKTAPPPADTKTPRRNSPPYQTPPSANPGSQHHSSLKSWWRRLTQHSSGNPDTPRTLSDAHKHVYTPRHAKRDALLSMPRGDDMPANLYRAPSSAAGEDPGLAVHPNREAYLRRLHSSNGGRKRGSPAWTAREAGSSRREGMESIREDDPDAGQASSQAQPPAQHSSTASGSGTPPTTAATSVDNGSKPSAYEVRARLQEVRAAKIERQLQAQISGWGGASGRWRDAVPTHPSPSNADGEDLRGKRKARAVIIDPEADRVSPSEFPLPPPTTPWSAHQRNESLETVEYSPAGTAFTSDVEGGAESVSAGSITSAEGGEGEDGGEKTGEWEERDAVDIDGWGRGVLESAEVGL